MVLEIGPLDGLCVRENDRKSQQIGREMSKRYSKKGGKGEEGGGEGGRMRAERGGDGKSRCFWNWTDRASEDGEAGRSENNRGGSGGLWEMCMRARWSPDQGAKPLYTSTLRKKGAKWHKSLCCPTPILFPSWLPWEIQLPRDFSLHLN